MIFAVKLKRHVIDASILGIIIDKFCYKKKPCLVILLKIDKSSKIGFNYIILPFGLTICLWVKANKEAQLNAKEIR